MAVMPKFYLHSFVLTLIMFGWYFFKVTDGGMLIDMGKSELGAFLIWFTVVWVVAELALMGLSWGSLRAIKDENIMDERETEVDQKSTRDAYYSLCVIIVVIILMALAPTGMLGSYDLVGHEAVIFVCVAASSFSFAVQCLSYVIYARA